MELINKVGFDTSYSFIYSPRPGTLAAKLADDVSRVIKQKRLALLQLALKDSAAAISRAMVGTKQRILVSKIAKKNKQEISGRTENNRVVNFIGSTNLIGQFVEVIITASLPNSLRGQLLPCK